MTSRPEHVIVDELDPDEKDPNSWQVGEVGTGGTQINEKINEALISIYHKIPQKYRTAISEGAKQGWESGSTMANGEPNPIQTQDLAPLLNLIPSVLKYKAAKALASRTLNINPELFDKAAISFGITNVAKKGIKKAIPEIQYKIGQKLRPYTGTKDGAIDIGSKENIMNEVFQIKDFTSGSIRKGGLFDSNAYGSLGPMYTSTQPKNLPTKSERLYDAILNDAPGMSYPTIEQVNFALKPKSKHAGEVYTRPDKTTEKQWAVIGKRLQETYGGTDIELKDFIERQKLARKEIKKEIAIENRLHQNNYLSVALEMIDNNMLKGVGDMEDLYGNKMAIQDVEDFVYLEAQKIKQNPSKANVMELGHIKSAKNIYDESKHLTTADYESNMRSEMKHSIRNYGSTKGKPLKIIKRKDAKGRTVYVFEGGHVVEPGNIHRGHDSDLPDIMNLFLGTMPNVETEYMRYIGELGYAVSPKQVIPSPAHYESYMKKRWRRWQGLGDTKVLGKQQLELFYKKIKQYTDDYLNALDEGKFLSNKAGSDAIDDMLIDKRTGVHQKRQADAEQRTIKRKIETMEDIFPDE